MHLKSVTYDSVTPDVITNLEVSETIDSLVYCDNYYYACSTIKLIILKPLSSVCPVWKCGVQ